MIIKDNVVVVMHYSVMDKEGTLIDSSFDDEPLAFIQGTRYLIPGLETELNGHVVGDKFTVHVPADLGYGQRDDNLMQAVDKSLFEGIDDLEVGARLRATTEDGEQSVIVLDITDDEIVVDGNHPLAGIDLQFDVEILEIRDATADELAHGHVHGEGSCAH
jgi:FKBP-type peptidyl-prolyl cis-trans isomerase SlyD